MRSLSNRLTLFALKNILRAHSFTYSWAGRLGTKVEGSGLHPKHRIMNYHKFFVDNVTENDTVLDIGCGNGVLLRQFQKKGCVCFGSDPSPWAREYAEQ